MTKLRTKSATPGSEIIAKFNRHANPSSFGLNYTKVHFPRSPGGWYTHFLSLIDTHFRQAYEVGVSRG